MWLNTRQTQGVSQGTIARRFHRFRFHRFGRLVLAGLLAVACSASAHSQEPPLFTTTGEIVDFGATSMVVVDAQNRSTTFRITPTTRLSLDARAARFDDLRVGDRVEVVTTPAEPRVALRVMAQAPAATAPPAQPAPPPAERPAGVAVAPADEPPPEYGTLGVLIGPSPTGVLVVSVQQGSPAEKVGLTPGSFIVSVNRAEVATPQELLAALEELRPGDTVQLSAWTGGETREMAVVLASPREFVDGLPRQPAEPQPPPLEVPPVLRGLSVRETEFGLEVAQVEPRSPAEQIRLARGDLIEQVGGVRVTRASDLYGIVERMEAGGQAEIRILRGERRINLVLQIPVTQPVVARRVEIVELPAEMPEYARILLRQQQDNAELIESLRREVRALRAEIDELRR